LNGNPEDRAGKGEKQGGLAGKCSLQRVSGRSLRGKSEKGEGEEPRRRGGGKDAVTFMGPGKILEKMKRVS